MTPANEKTRWRSKRHPLVRLKRKSRLVYLKILRINDPPERIARGAAIGVLMGILPTFMAGAVLAVIAAFIFKANKAAAVLGSLVMNPLTQPFVWTASITIGSLLLGEDSVTMLAKFKSDSLVNAFSHTGVVYLVGNVIVGSVFTLVTYYLIKKGVITHRRHKERKRIEKREAEGQS